MDLTTNSAFENQEEYLEHYGKRGMKWGVWNAETRARYIGMPRRAGKALQQTVKSASSTVAKGAKAVKSKAGAKILEMSSKRKEAKAEKEEIAKQREELGMTRTKYEALRAQTLKSHDPRVVERGMHTLTDKELNAKIDRLKREETISRMAADQSTRRHQESKARSEAIQANPLYKIGKDVLYKKVLGISGGKKKDKAKDEKPKEDKPKDNSSKSDTQITESPALLNKRYAKQYSANGYKEAVRKAVKSSAFNANINTNSARSAASKGQRLLTAEILSVETVGGPSRKALPPGSSRKALPSGRG